MHLDGVHRCAQKNLVRLISVSSVRERTLFSHCPVCWNLFDGNHYSTSKEQSGWKKAFCTSHTAWKLGVGFCKVSAAYAQPRSGQGKGQSPLKGLWAWTKKVGHVNLHTGTVLRSVLVWGAWLHPTDVGGHHCLTEALRVFVWGIKGVHFPATSKWSSPLAWATLLPFQHLHFHEEGEQPDFIGFQCLACS